MPPELYEALTRFMAAWEARTWTEMDTMIHPSEGQSPEQLRRKIRLLLKDVDPTGWTFPPPSFPMHNMGILVIIAQKRAFVLKMLKFEGAGYYSEWYLNEVTEAS